MPRTIVLQGEPLSTQHIYGNTRRGGRYMTAEGKAAKEAYGWEARMQWQYELLTRPIALRVDSFFKTKRKRDLDNQNKIILDALTGIIYDDSQIDELHLLRHYDRQRTWTEITIVPL